jgi:hypothetical protein
MPRKNVPTKRAVGRPRVDIPIERLLQLRASGLSFRQISDFMGLAYSTLRRAYWASQIANSPFLAMMAERDSITDAVSMGRL